MTEGVDWKKFFELIKNRPPELDQRQQFPDPCFWEDLYLAFAARMREEERERRNAQEQQFKRRLDEQDIMKQLEGFSYKGLLGE